MTLKTSYRFHVLDVIRGIGALSVVFWHWQHFFGQPTHPSPLDWSKLPYFQTLNILYTRGWLAVDLFFCISGFIFFQLYAVKIASRQVSPTTFGLWRLSRLYPLHFILLFVVSIGQYLFKSQFNNFFVYPWNDLKHFILNLFLGTSWGLSDGFSFNAPVWSVSVEIFLYAFFFVFCRYLPTKVLFVFVFLVIGALLEKHFASPIGRGMKSFFLGGLIYHFYFWAQVRPKNMTAAKVLVSFFAVSIGLIWYIAPSIPLVGGIYKLLDRNVENFATTLVLFPVLVASAIFFESLLQPLSKPVRFLGDCSYSLYLIHFPLQLVLVQSLWVLGFNNSIFYSGYFMIFFLGLLISLSVASYHKLETPLQNYIRDRWLRQSQKQTNPIAKADVK